MKTIEKILFPLFFLAAFIGMANIIPTIVAYILLIGMVIYLFSGWYILLPEAQQYGKRWLPLILSYLIAQVLVTVVFGIKEWPFMDTMAYVTSAMTLVALVLLVVFRKRLLTKYPVDGYILRMIICFMFAGSPLWMP